MSIENSAFPTPTWLAIHLAPKVWGAKYTFSADPWILHMEEQVLAEFLDQENESYVKASAPPQIGKSTWEEIFFPFWVLGHFPETRIILVTYNDRLAEKSGGQVRDLVMKFGPELFNIDVDPDIAAKGKWQLKDHRGGMISVGIGSSVTGESADILLIGDIIKNMEEAASKATKDKHWTEWDGTLKPRLQPGGLCLLMNTRFAEDDLNGRLEAQQNAEGYDGDRWINLRYPAIAEPEPEEEIPDPEAWRDQLGRRLGEPLQTRFTKPRDLTDWANSRFYKTKRSTVPFVFDCIYQGNATSAADGMFPREKWGWYDMDDPLPPIDSQRRVWDLAATKGGGDWSVGTKVAKVEDEFWWFDVQRFQKGPDAALEDVKAVALVDGLGCPIMIEQERSGAGRTTFAFYKTALSPHSVEPAIPDGTKEERAKPHSLLQQAGKHRLPRRRQVNPRTGEMEWWSPEWVTLLIREHAQMMGDGRIGRHDDMIDTSAYAINDMLGAGLTEMIETGLMMLGSGQMVSVLDRV